MLPAVPLAYFEPEVTLVREVPAPVEVISPRRVVNAKTREAFRSIYGVCDAFIQAGEDDVQRRELARKTERYNSGVGEVRAALEALEHGPEHTLARQLFRRVAYQFENATWWIRVDPQHLAYIVQTTKACWEELELLLAGQRLLFPEGVQ